MAYQIVTYPAAVLMRPARRIGPGDGYDLHQLFADMIDAMNANHGVGLAAPQVGLGIRFIVAHDIAGKQDHGLANPQIVRLSRECEVRSEGCLSFPELYGDVERSLSVTVRYQDLDWNPCEISAEGHFARVLQHEIDHLNGVLLLDRAIDGLYQWEDDEEEGDDEGGDDSAAGGGAQASTENIADEAAANGAPVGSAPQEAG
jgi:peptide deformylase